MADDAAPDEYERRYMDGDRAILRARQRQAAWVPALVLAMLLAVMAHFGFALAWLWQRAATPFAMAVFVASVFYGLFVVMTTLVAALIDHVTRITLTATHLRVHRGLWADDIPLAAITRVTAERMSPWTSKATLAGVILRRERDYASFGVREVLGVEWRDEKGRARKTWARFEGAETFRARIEALLGAPTGVRVVPETGSVEHMANSEEEGRTIRPHHHHRVG
jgi:uncharacterized membrane protein